MRRLRRVARSSTFRIEGSTARQPAGFLGKLGRKIAPLLAEIYTRRRRSGDNQRSGWNEEGVHATLARRPIIIIAS